MPQPIQITNQHGETMPAIALDFEITRESWAVYKLLDGGTVRVKTTVTRILHHVDDEGRVKYNPDGSPAVTVQSKIDVVSDA